MIMLLYIPRIRYESLLLEAQQTANLLDSEKHEKEMRITELKLENERMASRERERSVALLVSVSEP